LAAAPVGEEAADVAGADADAADEVAAADELLLLLEELHPAASRTAAASAASPARRTRLVIRRPAPLRPGRPSLLGLTPVPP
jgi:hypothetical protein